MLEGATRFWFVYFAVYVAAVLARLLELMRRRPDDAEAEKQIRWIGLGVIVGLAPFLILSALPRAFGLESPLLSTVAVVPLVLHPPLVRVRDPEVAPLGRRDLRPRGDRDDRRRPARRDDVRARQLAARPDAGRDGGGGQERHGVRLGHRARVAARAGQEADHRRARADPVPRHVSRAPRAARRRARLRDAASPRGGRPGHRAARRGGASSRSVLAVPVRGSRPRSRRRRAGRGARGRGRSPAARHRVRRDAAGGAAAVPRAGLSRLLRDALRRRARRSARRRATRTDASRCRRRTRPCSSRCSRRRAWRTRTRGSTARSLSGSRRSAPSRSTRRASSAPRRRASSSWTPPSGSTPRIPRSPCSWAAARRSSPGCPCRRRCPA